MFSLLFAIMVCKTLFFRLSSNKSSSQNNGKLTKLRFYFRYSMN